jgi:hypothetical protein
MSTIDLAGQETTLKAVTDRLIPKDDYPSGWEAGVGDYIYGLLAGDCASLVPLYRDGLAALNAEAQAVYGQQFDKLAESEQDALLRNVEAGRIETNWPVSPRQFFDRAMNQAMEGFYGDPGNGGNKGEVSWKMVGFEVTV